MIKRTSIFIISFLCFGTLLIAQTESTLDDLLEKLQENHMSSVSDVFTLEEQLILREHFSNLSDPENSEGAAVFLFGPNNSKGTFGSFDVMDPSVFSQISTSPLTEFEGAGAWDYNALNFKVIDNVGALYTLELNGTYNFVGNLFPPIGESFVGLEYDMSTDILYGLSTDGAGSSTLSTIDPIGPTMTPIGDTDIMLPINLAIDNASVAYTIGVDGNFSYRIELATAVATPLGDSGFDPNFGQGMSYDPNNDMIYLSAFNNTTFQSELRILDTTTGMTSFEGPIGNTVPGGTIQVGWVGSPDNQLSVGDNTLSNFSFYPNPARNILNVKANDNIENITIYNLLGQKVISQNINAFTSNINITSLTTGLYILKANINGKSGSYKLIKR